MSLRGLADTLTGDEWARVSQRREVAELVAAIQNDLDPGISGFVKVLRLAGVETYESCQGGEGHSYPEPSIRFHGTQGAGWWALQVCLDHGLPVRNLSRIWTVQDREPTGPTWQLVFAEMAR